MEKEKINILIADDHQMVIDGLKMMLDGDVYQVISEANNGQEAMDLIQMQPQQYHLLLTDISMPLLSGTELCRMIKSQFPHIPFS